MMLKKLTVGLLALLALPLIASAEMRNWTVTLRASDGTTVVGTGAFRADNTPPYAAPVVDFDVTVNATRYNVVPANQSPSPFRMVEFYNNSHALFAFVLSSTGDGQIPCIGFNQYAGFQWDYFSCLVAGGEVTQAQRQSGDPYGPYAVEAGPTTTPAVLGGFYPPVDSPAVGTNLAKAGQTIPLKFYAETTLGPITDLTTVNLSVVSTDCGQLDEGLDPIESYSTATNVPLENLGGGYYQYNWKTMKGATGCRVVTLTLPETYAADALVATIKFRK
jgi:hypothetical protein